MPQGSREHVRRWRGFEEKQPEQLLPWTRGRAVVGTRVKLPGSKRMQLLPRNKSKEIWIRVCVRKGPRVAKTTCGRHQTRPGKNVHG